MSDDVTAGGTGTPPRPPLEGQHATEHVACILAAWREAEREAARAQDAESRRRAAARIGELRDRYQAATAAVSARPRMGR